MHSQRLMELGSTQGFRDCGRICAAQTKEALTLNHSYSKPALYTVCILDMYTGHVYRTCIQDPLVSHCNRMNRETQIDAMYVHVP